MHISRRLHEHTARTASRVKKLLVTGDRTKYLYHILHDRSWSTVIFLIDLGIVLFEENIGITEEDETEDWLTIFVGSQVCSGTQNAGGMPKVIFQILKFCVSHLSECWFRL